MDMSEAAAYFDVPIPMGSATERAVREAEATRGGNSDLLWCFHLTKPLLLGFRTFDQVVGHNSVPAEFAAPCAGR